MGREIDRAARGDENIILKAHPDPLLRNVDPRLDGDHPAGLEGAVERREVVDAQAERMPQAVHEILPAGRLLRRVLGDLLRRDQAEAEQLIVHLELGRTAPVARGCADGRPTDRGLEDAVDGIVNGPLPRGEAAVDRIGAGQVGVVVGVAGADVDEEQVAVVADPVVGVVVENTSTFARGDDRLVGHFRPVLRELVDQLRLELVFHHPRLEAGEHPPQADVGDVDRPAEKLDLGRVLHRPQAPHDRRQPLVAVERIAGHELARVADVAGIGLGAVALVFVRVEKDPLALAHQDMKHAGQLREPADARDPGDLLGPFLRELLPFPGGQMLVRLTQEEDLALRRIGRLRREDEHALLLLDPGQMEEIGGRIDREGAVAGLREDIGGVDDRDRARRELGHELTAVGDEQRVVDRCVPHGFSLVRVTPAPDSARGEENRTRRSGRLSPVCSIEPPTGTPPGQISSNVRFGVARAPSPDVRYGPPGPPLTPRRLRFAIHGCACRRGRLSEHGRPLAWRRWAWDGVGRSTALLTVLA